MDSPVPDPVPDEHHTRPGPITLPEASASATAPLKRSASEAFEEVSDDEGTHKKLKDSGGNGKGVDGGANRDRVTLADNLEEELQCGCCSAIVYRPVVVNPCQHFFCGRCVCMFCVLAAGRMVVLKLWWLRVAQLRYALDQGEQLRFHVGCWEAVRGHSALAVGCRLSLPRLMLSRAESACFTVMF